MINFSHLKCSKIKPRRMPLPLIAILVLIFGMSMFPILHAGEAKRKILYIDSYHAELFWSNDVTTGIRSVLDPMEDIELKIFRMDTKRNRTEAYKKKAALKARDLIEAWHPDVVIASDDNASKYLIAPYYRNTKLPVVFCGLNTDAAAYGFPADNVTGMTEVALIVPLIDTLKKYAAGDRIGHLASDTMTQRKEYENTVSRFNLRFEEVRFAKNFDALKQAYLELQQRTDMVILRGCNTVREFNHLEMVEFVRKHTVVPTGTLTKDQKHYALITFSKIGEEQGEYAAKTALDILNGADPKTIPVVTNKKARPYLNMRLAKIMGIKFPMEMIQNSHLVSAEQKKLFYVNSYHAGYTWSDDIETGLLMALNIKKKYDGTYDDSGSGVTLKIFRMDTKLNTSEEFKIQSALAAKTMIDEWHPDIIVTSDDNASKYLVAPYLKGTSIPVVFCGLNWDADVYGFPTDNITGMVEVDPILETIELLKPYARGGRIGYIGAKVYSEEKEVDHWKNMLHISFSDGALVSDFQEWQKTYLRLQKTVDMIVWLSPIGIKGWNDKIADLFVQRHTVVPTGGTADVNIRYALLGKIKVAEEQGWWAGNTALRILDGIPVKNIPVTTNKNSKLCLNMKLAKKMGIKFPVQLIEKATLFDN